MINERVSTKETVTVKLTKGTHPIEDTEVLFIDVKDEQVKEAINVKEKQE